MGELGAVHEDHQEILRLVDLQAIPAVIYNEKGQPEAEAVSFHIMDVQALCRQAFMVGHTRHLSWEAYADIVASWRSYEQRSKFNNRNVDLENVQKEAAKNVKEFLDKSKGETT